MCIYVDMLNSLFKLRTLIAVALGPYKLCMPIQVHVIVAGCSSVGMSYAEPAHGTYCQQLLFDVYCTGGGGGGTPGGGGGGG